MIKKLSFLLICINILCAENVAKSVLDSAENPKDSALFAESMKDSIVDSADSTNAPPHHQQSQQQVAKRRI